MTDDPTVRHASHSRVGTRFGPYLLRRLLGTGGFGEVYEAEDTVMHRVVALKLLSSSYSHNPAFRERLFREARTAGRLHDPHVVPIHGCGEIDGQLYIDMRLIDGTNLQSMLERDGALAPARAVNIVRQIAAALDAAHAETVIHRDVKPANILLGKDDFACLVDFGLANAATDTKLTSEGTTIGSFAYLAPERLASGEVTPGADIYALACVLHECLTGASPFQSRTEIPALVAAHLTSPPPRPSQQRPGIPAGFDEVIARGMAKEPERRYRSAGELAAAAQHALSTPVVHPSWTPQSAPPTQAWHPPVPAPAPTMQVPHAFRRKSRRRIAVILAALGAIVVVTAIVVAVSSPPNSSQPARSTTNGPSTPTAPIAGAAPPLNATPLTTIGYGDLGGVTVDAAGNVFVVDTGTKKVFKLAANSNAPTEIPIRGLTKPKSVAVDSAGNLYLTDWSTPGTGQVWKVPPGATSPVELPFGAILPSGLAVDGGGDVYVAARDQVLRLAVDASAPTVLPFGGGLFESVALDGAGNVYGLQMGRVLKLAPGATSPTQLPFSQLGRAQGIAVDAKSTIYVIDNSDNLGKLLKLRAGATTSTTPTVPENQSFGGVAVDAAGNVYLTENNRLLKVGAG
ncbi:serine/threonine-protein kinase [Mycobacterium sp.]|uniref:serine/threonine-protein kinase n=1 Tax=Mycobacterium sp. TaxID=1785 RepID=UPI000CC1D924|nr:serine/threonine-protein kinase [Mycobacterium sp.]PJE06479.1 MAG: serine/threonine protein kinase [Mycobacterium sp.]